MQHRVRIGLFVALVLVINSGIAHCQEDAAAEEAKAWQARRADEFGAYRIRQVTPQGEVDVIIEKASVLSWSNPIRKTAAGAVFLWTIDGRPQMIASTYPYELGIEQELTSLSEFPLHFRNEAGFTYKMPVGVEWKDVPDADAPHQQRALRLTQMRRIAERFRVQGGGNKKFDTRLLTQPIYRSPTTVKIEAAVFAFVQGTDPEAVLLIESTGKPVWRYAFARMTSVPIAADLDDNRVWELPASWSVAVGNQPFRTIQLPGAK